ncbi:hypothetical protein P7C70_g2150, partial [Phenoliferia sp. Uapishka_3]
MFASSHQPSVLSLFSSTSSSPLLLASTSSASPPLADSFIALLDDATDANFTLISGPATSSSTLKGKGTTVPRGNLRSRILHLEAPDPRSTHVQWGSGSKPLGITLPLLVLQLKDLGQAFFFEVGVRDERGNRAVIRASTFQQLQSSPKAYSTNPPLLHLPLSFPAPSPSTLTPWTTLTLHLPALLSAFSRLDNGRIFAKFSSLDFVKVYANCRLRRIWCAEEGESGEVEEGMAVRGMRTELGMFEAGNNEEGA